MFKTKSIVFILAVVIVAVALIALPVIYISSSPHWSPSPYMQKTVERLRLTPRNDVLAINVSFSNEWEFTLRRPKDDRDINKLLNSLRQMKVVYTKSGIERGGGLIIITVKGSPYNDEIRIEGKFQPGEYFISESLRSDDLGKIVYDIAKRKGIKPRKQNKS
jgi:hypothetical protein